MNAPARITLYLSPAEAEEARDAAWDRYLSTPHTDPRVGRDRYHASLKAIAMLERPETEMGAALAALEKM